MYHRTVYIGSMYVQQIRHCDGSVVSEFLILTGDVSFQRQVHTYVKDDMNVSRFDWLTEVKYTQLLLTAYHLNSVILSLFTGALNVS